jgi:putative membrane-bound dehydrogenase-like protein
MASVWSHRIAPRRGCKNEPRMDSNRHESVRADHPRTAPQGLTGVAMKRTADVLVRSALDDSKLLEHPAPAQDPDALRTRTSAIHKIAALQRLIHSCPFVVLLFSLHTFAADVPQVLDDRLQIQLVAGEPQIVTPIGLAIDPKGRLFVVESHTHSRPSGYPGPKSDRIKVFTDKDGDGLPETISTFADGLHEALTVALGPNGDVFVCCADKVIALHDRDGDDVSETRTTLLTLDTVERNPHGRLLSVALSPDGWLYIGRGNTGGNEYTLRGTDGSVFDGYGDGGNIVRCRPDGSQVQLFATGFWNPFELKFDRFGRLLCADNDPDSRGPNRLLHILQGGDYGFKALYGPTGLHPYQAWDGELPGTLPMISGTGEAPSGILECTRAALPADYRDSLLVTVWGEHTIERHKLRPQGVSLRADREILVQGGREFRPVCIDAAPDGSIYLTDWVLKDYPNHGRGRIWRISAKPGTEVDQTAAQTPLTRSSGTLSPPSKGRGQGEGWAAVHANSSEHRLDDLFAASEPKNHAKLIKAATDDDPFVRSAAVTALARPAFHEQVQRDLSHKDSNVRLAALLALRHSAFRIPHSALERLFADPDESVRRMALIWTGELELRDLRDQLDRALTAGPASPTLIDVYLATAQILNTPTAKPGEKRPRGFAIKRDLDPALVEALVHDETKPAALRVTVLRLLANPGSARNLDLLTRLVEQREPALRRAAIQTLGAADHSIAREALVKLAKDKEQPAELRAEAVAALAHRFTDAWPVLLPLLWDSQSDVKLEAARFLRSSMNEPDVRRAFQRRLWERSSGVIRLDDRAKALEEQFELVLLTKNLHRPDSLAAWSKAVATGGDPDSGRRVFFSPLTGCANCHRIHGRGNRVGPDLSTIARTANRQQLLRSILKPSDDIAPQFLPWTVETTDGESHNGLQGHLRGGGTVTMILMDGRNLTVPGSKVASYGASKLSLMPEGLEQTMTVSDLRDLIAYLESLK